jgi:hypothetical protein
MPRWAIYLAGVAVLVPIFFLGGSGSLFLGFLGFLLFGPAVIPSLFAYIPPYTTSSAPQPEHVESLNYQHHADRVYA